MKKINLNKQDLTVIYEKLENGLEIFAVPMPNVKTIYATFTTKYGSNINEFVPINSKKMKKYPDGIAHFLEHKMFEEESGVDPFTFFAERGSDANANTSNYKTTYLFSGTNFFNENLNYLLDYVQRPYFTDENVNKEKGIIKQEIKMYLDDPYTRIYEKSIYNSFNVLPIKIPIIGDIKSINSITKEDLYECYNTFYHPSNMFVVVTGNIDGEETIKLIKENQKKKEYTKSDKIITKKYKEPDKVNIENDEIKMDVSIEKVSINYKIRINKIKGIDTKLVKTYLKIYFDILCGATSDLVARLKDKKVITDLIYIDYLDTDEHLLSMLMVDTNLKKEYLESIKEIIGKSKISEEDFERKKRVLISSLIYSSDNPYSVNEKIMNQVVKYGEIINDEYGYIKSLNIDDFNKVIESLNFNNISTVVVKK